MKEGRASLLNGKRGVTYLMGTLRVLHKSTYSLRVAASRFVLSKRRNKVIYIGPEGARRQS